MLDVCLRRRGGLPTLSLPRSNRIQSRHSLCFTLLIAGPGPQYDPASEYQNMVRSTYAPVPRPPQTQAAHFKRPYRN